MSDIRVGREETGVELANIIRHSPIKRDDSCYERYKVEQRKHRDGAT